MTDVDRPAPYTQADVASLYSRVAPAYAEQGPPYFTIAGRRLVQLAKVASGDVVLDVGTGRGAVLMPAAESVGPLGEAVGIDIAAGMLEATRAELQRLGLRQASTLRMDASRLDFPPERFTHVLSSFSVFFFPDVRQTLRGLWRVLRPKGTAGFAFSRGQDPRWTWYHELLRDSGALDHVRAGPGDESIRLPGRLAGLLESAGFVDIVEVEEPTDFVYPSAEAWWSSLWTHGSRRALEALDSTSAERLRIEAMSRASKLAGPEGLPERMHLIYVLARRAD